MSERESFEAEYSKGDFGIAGCDLSKHADGSYINDDAFSAFFWFKAGLAHANVNEQSQAQQPTELSEQLREYAGNSGYSHNDYADTMLAAATEIERLASQAQQSQWMPIETAPTGKEFLLAFYYRHRPHDVLRRVVTFIDKDIIALGWSEIPPAPEGDKE